MKCARHPNVETVIRCGRCETPVCPKCSVMGPAGIRCRDCASLRSSPLYQVPADRFALGVLAGGLAGTIVGYLLAAASGFGFFLLWGGVLGGGAVGEALLRATGRKRGTNMEIAAGVCAGLGAVVGFLLWCAVNQHPLTLQALLLYGSYHPFYAVGVGLAVFSAISRVRFL